jgi:hypothetical protein
MAKVAGTPFSHRSIGSRAGVSDPAVARLRDRRRPGTALDDSGSHPRPAGTQLSA